MHQGIDMKSFKEHLAESKRTYTFRVKVAGDTGDYGAAGSQEKAIESLLSKFEVSSFKKVSKTPIQELPLDFPKLKNTDVTIYEVNLDYPTTQFELTEYLATGLGVTQDRLVVRSPNEPLESYQQPAKESEGALLTDGEYKEAENANFEEFYGDKYNTGFVKELNDILKLQRKERGEVIPEGNGGDSAAAAPAKYLTDLPQNNQSPIKQATDPRK